MGLIDRYIYAVTRHLPEKQREDIAKELRGLIEDMLEQRKGEQHIDDADIEAVLTELGEPSALATKYYEKPHYLIGPELFETYIMVLKIVLAAFAFGAVVAMTIHYAVTPPQYISEVIGNIIGSIFSGIMEGFALVTIVFAIIDYYSVDSNAAKLKRGKWNPSDLPEIPVKEVHIKRSGPIVGIIFIVMFFVILNFAPELLNVHSSKLGVSTITPFDLSVLKSYMPLINIWFAVAIFKNIMKIVYGRYNLRFAVINMILISISFIVAMIVFSNFQIWNWNFITSIENSCNISILSNYEIAQRATIFAKVFLGVIIFSYSIDMISTIMKTIKAFPIKIGKG